MSQFSGIECFTMKYLPPLTNTWYLNGIRLHSLNIYTFALSIHITAISLYFIITCVHSPLKLVNANRAGLDIATNTVAVAT